MTVGILKEPQIETRVSLIPEAVAQLTKKGINVKVEPGAGSKASASDSDYEKAGAQILPAADIVASADIILSIHAPELNIPSSKILVGVYQPLFNRQLMEE